MAAALVTFGVIGATLSIEGWILYQHASLFLAHPSVTELLLEVVAFLLASNAVVAWFRSRPAPEEVIPTPEGLKTLRRSVFGRSRVLYPWRTIRGLGALRTPDPTLTILALSVIPPRALALEVERAVAERFPRRE